MADDTSSIAATPKLGIRVSDAVLSPVPPVEPSISSVRPDAGSQSDLRHEEELVWPPLTEDLKRLYIDQKLSASKIAKVYGLSYASPKSAESTILNHLKRNGIARRNPAAHVRKVSDSMVDDWIVRYQKGESLKQIAGTSVSPVTVFNHLHKRGLVLRDKVEAQIVAVKEFDRLPFDGDEIQRAYLLGLARGDFGVSWHGRAIRVKTSSTHPAMIELALSLFAGKGATRVYPRFSKLAGFEWTFEVDLDRSFAFLLHEKKKPPTGDAKETVLAYLAGLFDAEGSLWIWDGRAFAPRLSFTNKDLTMLGWIETQLSRLGFQCSRSLPDARGVCKTNLWRKAEVVALLEILPIRHPEKVAKARLVIGKGQRIPEFDAEWYALLDTIESERAAFIEAARGILCSGSSRRNV